jgi:hypothetical protein
MGDFDMGSIRKKILAATVLTVLILFNQSTGWGYEEVPVASGGTLGGKVVLKGTPPPARIFHLIFSPNIDFCGRISDGKGNRLLREFKVSEDGGLQDVVVAVVGVEKGKKFDYTPELTIENCRIAPFVTAIRNREKIVLNNKDSIAHDIQGYTLKDAYTFAMFNKPLTPESSATKEVRFRKDHYVFRTQCGVHDYMQSWGFAIGNPYFAVTGPDGTFQIADLPPGDYHVIAWHPHMAIQAKQITVPENGKVPLSFQFDASEVEIPLHDLQKNYRLETALQPHHIFPPIELQVP